MVIRVDQCAEFEAIPSKIHGTPQFDPFYQFKIGQEWRVERRKIPRLPGALDHYSAPHYSDVIMSAMACQITGALIAYSTGLFRCRLKKTSKLRVTGLMRGIHRWPVNSMHRRPVTRNIFPFDDVIVKIGNIDVGGECSSMKCEVSAPP